MAQTKETVANAWEANVKNEVNTVLNTFLSKSESGNIGIRYYHPSIEYETGVEYDEGKAVGVSVTVVLKFENTIDLSE